MEAMHALASSPRGPALSVAVRDGDRSIYIRKDLRRQQRARLGALRNASRAVARTGSPPPWCQTRSRSGWLRCCGWYQFDMIGSRSCFGYWPTWEYFICCGSRLGRSSLSRLWRDNFTGPWVHGLPREASDVGGGPTYFLLHHKTGHRLVQGWFDRPGWLRRALGLRPANTSSSLVPFVMDRPRAAVAPYYQGWVAQYVPEGTTPADTPEQLRARTALLVSNTFVGLLMGNRLWTARAVHFVRRPSDIVVSSYQYHLRSAEPWEHAYDPPSCLNCDYSAWLEIFGERDFRSSFFELLSGASASVGLGLEALRSRWQITRMLYNLHRFQDSPSVLHMRLDALETKFDSAFRCIVRFVQRAPPPAPPLGDLDQLVGVARRLSPAVVRRRCNGNGTGQGCTREQAVAAPHMSPLAERRRLRRELGRLARRPEGRAAHIAPADALLEALLARGRTPLEYGCPLYEARRVPIPPI